MLDVQMNSILRRSELEEKTRVVCPRDKPKRRYLQDTRLLINILI
jgi:hypothetical protein